jgi:hypothetical protein
MLYSDARRCRLKGVNRSRNPPYLVAIHLGFALLLCFPGKCATLVEPVHTGKALSEWLVELDARPSSEEIEVAYRQGRDSSAAYELKKVRDETAIRQIGTNALPVLLEILGIKAETVTNVLSSLKAREFQALLGYEKLDLNDIRKIAVDGFAILGTNGESATPQLSNLLHDPELCEQAARA